ncbi:MAG: DMT family transporter [Dehalococcoidia bacterium]
MPPPERRTGGGDLLRLNALTEHREGLLAVLCAALLWSTGGLFIKWVDLDVLSISWWRAAFAYVTVLIVSRPGLRAPWREDPVTWGIAISYSAVLILFVAATRLTTAANAIFLQYTAPIYLIGTSVVFLRERITALDLATVAVAVGGMALFFVERLDAGATRGNLLALCSGLSLAAMFTFFRHPRCTPDTRPRAMALGNALMVIGLLAVNTGRGAWSGFAPDPSDLFGVAFLGAAQIGLGYAIFGFGIARVAALEASLIGMLEPVLNPVWVFVFLGESPGWWGVVGGAVIIGAVTVRTVLVERGRPAP